MSPTVRTTRSRRAIRWATASLVVIALGVPTRGWWEPALWNALPNSALRFAAEQFPRGEAALLAAGRRADDAGHIDDAALFFSQAVELAPERAETLAALGFLRCEMGDLPAAERLVTGASPELQKAPEIELLAARTRLEAAGPEETARRADVVLHRHPSVAEGWYLLGLCYSQLHNTQQSVDAFGRAIHLRPRHASYYREAAQVWHQVGVFPEAERLARRSLALAPDDPTAALVLAEILLDRDIRPNSLSEAERLLERAAGFGPIRKTALRELGRARELGGDWKGALLPLEEATTDGHDPQALYFLAQAQLRTHDPAYPRTMNRFHTLEVERRTERFLRAAVKERQRDFQPRRRLVEFYLSTRRREEAQAVLADYLKAMPDDTQAKSLASTLSADTRKEVSP